MALVEGVEDGGGDRRSQADLPGGGHDPVAGRRRPCGRHVDAVDPGVGAESALHPRPPAPARRHRGRRTRRRATGSAPCAADHRGAGGADRRLPKETGHVVGAVPETEHRAADARLWPWGSPASTRVIPERAGRPVPSIRGGGTEAAGAVTVGGPGGPAPYRTRIRPRPAPRRTGPGGGRGRRRPRRYAVVPARSTPSRKWAKPSGARATARPLVRTGHDTSWIPTRPAAPSARQSPWSSPVSIGGKPPARR
jgi:hypothetical protein